MTKTTKAVKKLEKKFVTKRLLDKGRNIHWFCDPPAIMRNSCGP